MRTLWIGLLSLALPILAAVPLAAQTTGRPPGDGPTEVKIQIIFLDLERVSSAEQNFTANLAYRARWKDERLRHAGPGQTFMPLSDIWHPRVQVVNQQSLQKTLPDEARVSPEGEVATTQRFWGQFSQPMQLHDFPFDEQTLSVEVVAAGQEPGAVTFIADPEGPSAVPESLSVSDWRIHAWNAHPFDFTISTAARTLPGFRIDLTAARVRRYHMVQVVLPLVMIICMSWIVFWINPANANPRISVSVTAMLTLVAYRFAIAASLPRIAYLTRLDWFILGSSLLVFASLIEVAVTSVLCEKGRDETARRLNVWMRVVCPIAFVLVALLALA